MFGLILEIVVVGVGDAVRSFHPVLVKEASETSGIHGFGRFEGMCVVVGGGRHVDGAECET